MKAIRILTLITALFSGGGLAANSAPATSAVSLTGEKAVAQLKESGQYDSIAAAYEAARHAVRADEAEPDGVLRAQNPGHGLSASFDRHGLHLSVQRHGSEGERLITRWRLDSVGRAGAVEKVPAGDALRRDGQRAEIVRAGLGLTEWFVNRPSGLEHGFTLDRRPAGEGALRLDIAIEGDLSPVPGADGQRIELHDAAGAKVLDYDKLRVWDAAGQELPARMEQAAAGGLRFRVEDAGARYPLTVDPTFTQQAYLKASNASAGVIPALGDGFGFSVAVDGNTVVIGAISEDGNATSSAASPNDNAPDAGAAYVFTRNGTTWTQQAYLKASNAGVGDSFGNSVAVSGDTVVVGASQEQGDAASTAASPNDNASQAGAAYVFTRSGSTWTQQAYLKASNAGTTDFFGGSVAVSGDTVVVGASQEQGDAASTAASPNDNAQDAGAAYVFTRNGSTWTQQAYLKAANAENKDQFGRSVAISGNTVVVGSEGEAGDAASTAASPNNNANGAGAAYVFLRSGITWTQQAYLKAANAQGSADPDEPDGDSFGTSVAVSGDTVVVGASREGGDAASTAASPNDNARSAGAAYVFIRSGSTWSQQAYLKAANAERFDEFGNAVAVSGDTIVVGASLKASQAGAAYVFTRSGTTWSQQNLNAANAGAGDFFGRSVAVSGDTVVVGAPYEDGNAASTAASPNESATDAGAAYVFAAPPSPPTLTSVSPATGSTAGGTIVTLTGTNFTGATNVTFGGTAATNRTVVNPTTITCTTPAGTAGARSVLVTTPGGTNAANTLFTYVAPPSPPTLTSLTPNSGTTAGGTVVTLTGTNFTGATNVTFGGTAATNRTVVNATTITCTTPARAAGTASVLVTTPGGTNAANTLFTYVAPPTLTSVSPNSGPTAGGTMVTLTGTNFTGATGVTFGGAGPAATNVIVVNATTITCTTPARTAASRSVQVTTPGGFSGTQLFTFVDPASPPTLTSVSPNSGSTAGGTVVTLTGTNFTGATNVTFGGTAATNRTVVNATTITCTTPARAAGTTSVLVTTPGGTNAANTLFTYVPQQIIGTLNIYWVGLSGPSAGCGAIETTDGTPADAADGNITMSGVSVSDPCISTATYTFTVSPDKLTLTGADTLNTVPMVLTRTPDQPFFSGLWESGGESFRAYISAAPFTPSPATLTTAAYTGSNPTLNGGALYGFPIVSDSKTLPATLTVTSTSAGTLLSGNSPVAGNNLNTGFRTNINMTPPAGQFQVTQTISLALPGAFDDGLRLDYNGQTVLDFDFSNYSSIPAVNSMFGGGWTPWTGEGAPIVLELDASGLRLMVTATSNGTGAAAGVLTGQRVNVLNYFTSDTYVPDPADPDFVSGVQIGLYNRNQTGGWAMPNVALTATVRVIPRHTAQITRAPGGNPSLLFQGIASQSYLIQRSTNLLNWSTIHTASAAANGTLSYTDTTPPAGRAYYRIALP